MKFMLILLVLSCYVLQSKSSFNELPVHPGVGGLYNGPNSETIIKGPDGSVITAQQEGGFVVTQGLSQPIVVADIEPVQSVQPVISTVTVAPEAVAAPVIVSDPIAVSTPAVLGVGVSVVPVVPVDHIVEIIQPDPHIIETEIVDAPVIEPQQSSDLVGPSGSISTRGSSSVVSGPASTTISEPAKVVIATPLVAAVPVISTVTTPLRAVVPGPVTSSFSTVTAPVVNSAELLVSSPAPPVSLRTLSPPAILSTTVSPTVLLTGEINPIPSLSTVKALIEPASSYGVVSSPGQEVEVSSTARPELFLSSTLPPVPTSDQGVRISSSTSDNRQLNINPSLIPSANIIPPEIGPLPPGAIDLGTTRTVTVSTTPRGSEVISPTESPNIQRIGSDNSVLLENGRAYPQVDGRIEQLYTNQITFTGNPEIPSSTPYPLLRDTNPFPAGIPSNGLIGTPVADSPPISLTNIPLSSVSSIPLTIDQEIDEVSAQLWNRYGRDVIEKKVKDKIGENKE